MLKKTFKNNYEGVHFSKVAGILLTTLLKINSFTGIFQLFSSIYASIYFEEQVSLAAPETISYRCIRKYRISHRKVFFIFLLFSPLDTFYDLQCLIQFYYNLLRAGFTKSTDQTTTDHRPTDPKFTDSLTKFYFKDLIIKNLFCRIQTQLGTCKTILRSILLNLCLFFK